LYVLAGVDKDEIDDVLAFDHSDSREFYFAADKP
jgi:hypothetical protein